jgi:RND family efflux transporter MFP subunit
MNASLKFHHRDTESQRKSKENFSVFSVTPWLNRVPFAVLLLALLLSPIAAVRAQGGSMVTASAVIQPARVARLGFLSTALVKEISVKEGDVVHAGQILATLDTPELEFAVTATQAALRSAKSYAELQRYGGSRTFRGGQIVYQAPPHEMIEKADMRVTLAQATLEAAQAAHAQSTLVAPFAGTVTSLPVLPGQMIQLDQPVIVLAALDQLQIETTDLSERDIAKIKVGQKATVFIDALDAEFPATVIAIAPRADNVGGDVVFKVTLVFDEQPVGLLWGMTAEVTITTE